MKSWLSTEILEWMLNDLSCAFISGVKFDHSSLFRALIAIYLVRFVSLNFLALIFSMLSFLHICWMNVLSSVPESFQNLKDLVLLFEAYKFNSFASDIFHISTNYLYAQEQNTQFFCNRSKWLFFVTWLAVLCTSLLLKSALLHHKTNQKRALLSRNFGHTWSRWVSWYSRFSTVKKANKILHLAHYQKDLFEKRLRLV